MRLIYDEERENLTLKKEVSLTVYELVQKMIALGIVTKRPAYKDLHMALQELAGFHIVERMDGIWREPETRFLIYPSILFVLSNAKINELNDLIEERADLDSEQESFDFEEEEEDSETI